MVLSSVPYTIKVMQIAISSYFQQKTYAVGAARSEAPLVLIALAISESSDDAAHACSLVGAFADRTPKR